MQVLLRAEELVVHQQQVVAGVDGRAVKLGVPGRVGDLHGAHLAHGLLHGGGVLRLFPVGVDGDHGGNALGHRLGLEDDDLLVLHQIHALLGGHDDVLVVGQNVDDLRRGLADLL